MKFTDSANPYFGGGKLTMQEWVNEDIKEMEKEMQKEDFEGEECYGVSKIITYDLILADGGPSMRVEIDTEDNKITGGRYCYAWWGSPEEVELSESEAESVANYYDIMVHIENGGEGV